MVVVLSLIVAECATLFVLFVPVVPQTATEPCYPIGGSTQCPLGVLVFNYYGSISFHYFNVGMTYGAYGGLQMVTSPSWSPLYCLPIHR